MLLRFHKELFIFVFFFGKPSMNWSFKELRTTTLVWRNYNKNIETLFNHLRIILCFKKFHSRFFRAIYLLNFLLYFSWECGLQPNNIWLIYKVKLFKIKKRKRTIDRCHSSVLMAHSSILFGEITGHLWALQKEKTVYIYSNALYTD